MITCYLRYLIDPTKLKEFETYSRVWIGLVNRFEGVHHGYLMPSEGASNVAVAAFTFPSLAAYEIYRLESADDPDCIAAFKYAETTQCIVSYERSFFRPVTDALPPSALDGKAAAKAFAKPAKSSK
jgi:NIPSNAP